MEDRLVGIKSREVYEAPAATALHAAHRALEGVTLSKDQLRLKERIAQEYAEHVYNGLWFTALHQDLEAFVASTQRYVTGSIRLKLFKGRCVVVGTQLAVLALPARSGHLRHRETGSTIAPRRASSTSSGLPDARRRGFSRWSCRSLAGAASPP